MKSLIVLSLLISGCGFNGNQLVTTQGTTYQDMSIIFGFIDQVKQLCRESLLQQNYTDQELYNQAVAQCTFDRLTAMNLPDYTKYIQ